MTKLRSRIPVFYEAFKWANDSGYTMYAVQRFPFWGFKLQKDSPTQYMEVTIFLN